MRKIRNRAIKAFFKFVITIISGEPYQAHQYLNELRTQKSAEGFEIYSLDAEEMGEAFSRTLADLLAGQTLFKRKKFVVARLKDGNAALDFLKEYSGRAGDNALVFYAPGEKSLASKNTGAEAHHFVVPSGQGLKTFIVSELAKRGAKSSSAFASSLLSSLPRQLATLYPVIQEIEKYSLAPNHYNALAAGEAQSNPFGITEALARKDIKNLLITCEKQFTEGQKPFDILTRIIWQLRVLLLVSDLKLETKNSKLTLHPFVIKKAREALRAFWGDDLNVVFLDAISCYEKMLFSSLPSQLLLSRFFLKISRG